MRASEQIPVSGRRTGRRSPRTLRSPPCSMRSFRSRDSRIFTPDEHCSPPPPMCAFDFKFLLALVPLALSAQPAGSTGCVSCHGLTDSPTMHTTGTVYVSCVDCHGGNVSISRPIDAQPGSSSYKQAEARAHPKPRYPELWRDSANPVRVYANWLKESAEYIRFVNPGDLRVAQQTCG